MPDSRSHAPGMKETMDAFHELLRGAVSAPEIATRYAMPAERLAAYQRFVRNHISLVLNKNYAILSELLGGETWGDLVARFFEEHPARSFELNSNAESFRELLAQVVAEGEAGLSAFHLELAELEWQEFVVFTDPRELPRSETLDRPVLNPTLMVLDFTYPVADFVERWRLRGRGAPQPGIPPKAFERVLIFREPRSRLVVFYHATDELIFVTKMLHQDVDVAQAADLSGLSTEEIDVMVAYAREIGLILLPRGARPNRGRSELSAP